MQSTRHKASKLEHQLLSIGKTMFLSCFLSHFGSVWLAQPSGWQEAVGRSEENFSVLVLGWASACHSEILTPAGG